MSLLSLLSRRRIPTRIRSLFVRSGSIPRAVKLLHNSLPDTGSWLFFSHQRWYSFNKTLHRIFAFDDDLSHRSDRKPSIVSTVARKLEDAWDTDFGIRRPFSCQSFAPRTAHARIPGSSDLSFCSNFLSCFLSGKMTSKGMILIRRHMPSSGI